MRPLEPRKVPAYRRHAPTGQAVVTLDDRDLYLGPHGNPESRLAYDRLIRDWIDRGLGQGRAPRGWVPALTGHAGFGVPTIEDLVDCLERHLERRLGAGWSELRAIGVPVGPIRGWYSYERPDAHPRWGDRSFTPIAGAMVADALGGLRDLLGPVAAAVFGPREWRLWRDGWRCEHRTKVQEVEGNLVVLAAFRRVTGRWPPIPRGPDPARGRPAVEYGFEPGSFGDVWRPGTGYWAPWGDEPGHPAGM